MQALETCAEFDDGRIIHLDGYMTYIQGNTKTAVHWKKATRCKIKSVATGLLVSAVATNGYVFFWGVGKMTRAQMALIAAGAAVVIFGGKKVVDQFWKIDPRGNKYDALFTAAESANGLPVGLLRRMAYQESRFNPAARSPVGALGLMQFMPATAKEFNIDPLNPAQSIAAAGKYMAQLHKQAGSWTGAVAAYNWGIGNVLRKGIKNAPAETVAYMQIAADVGVA